ncbi:MAG: hypothetical protein Q8S18_00160 [Bacteroidales bacterium]|nr:hypothetical protein [Bacteroidales bacterium]
MGKKKTANAVNYQTTNRISRAGKGTVIGIEKRHGRVVVCLQR